MYPLMIVLRLAHVVLGVYWAGTLFFVVTFLLPGVRDAGSEGERVILALQRRRYFETMPVVAALTIVSGLLLYWRVSNGFAMSWIRSGEGLSLTVGGFAALMAFAIGVGVMRPVSLRAIQLAQSVKQLPEGAAGESRLAEIQALRMRAAASVRWMAGLLAVVVATMAVARYV